MLEVIFLENNFLEKDYEGETRKYESMLSWIIRWTFDTSLYAEIFLER